MTRDTRKSGRDGLYVVIATAIAGMIGSALDLSAEQQAALVGIVMAAGTYLYRRFRTWRGVAP